MPSRHPRRAYQPLRTYSSRAQLPRHWFPQRRAPTRSVLSQRAEGVLAASCAGARANTSQWTRQRACLRLCRGVRQEPPPPNDRAHHNTRLRPCCGSAGQRWPQRGHACAAPPRRSVAWWIAVGPGAPFSTPCSRNVFSAESPTLSGPHAMATAPAPARCRPAAAAGLLLLVAVVALLPGGGAAAADCTVSISCQPPACNRECLMGWHQASDVCYAISLLLPVRLAEHGGLLGQAACLLPHRYPAATSAHPSSMRPTPRPCTCPAFHPPPQLSPCKARCCTASSPSC
jgi:hypothetical protein